MLAIGHLQFGSEIQKITGRPVGKPPILDP